MAALSNEGNEPMHVHAVTGDAECKYWIACARFSNYEDFKYTCTRAFETRSVPDNDEHFDQIVADGTTADAPSRKSE
jgi:hypothetical protein